jgi:HK97 family phage major capsid protein
MRIKLLKNYDKHKEGDVLPVDDKVGQKYIDMGFAEQAPEANPLENLGETIAKGVADGLAKATLRIDQGHDTKHPAHARLAQGEYTNVHDGKLHGLSVFQSTGGFLHAVREMSSGNPSQDAAKKCNDWHEMQTKAGQSEYQAKGVGSPSGMHEGSDSDGGFLVIPEFAQSIYDRAIAQENFIGEANNIVIRGNTMTLPALDDYSRANGQRWGGITGYWTNEAEQMTSSRPKGRTMDLRLKKLHVLCYITDELLSDSAYALEQYVLRGASNELRFKTNDAMIEGDGAGQPLGIKIAPSTISVGKETNQAAATIVTTNIDKMWMRLNAGFRSTAKWYINQDCEAALQSMALPVGIGGTPTYLPAGGVSATPYATLKGRPVVPIEFAETLGTQGDIILTSWQGYQSITKGGVQTDMSMHVRFLYGEMAYRLTFRMDGQPLWDKPLTPFKGSTTTSTTVILDTRA